MHIKRQSLSTRLTSLIQLHSLTEGLLFFTLKRMYDPSRRTSHITHPFASCCSFLAQNPSIIFQSFLFLFLIPHPAPRTITTNSPAPPLLYPQHAHTACSQAHVWCEATLPPREPQNSPLWGSSTSSLWADVDTHSGWGWSPNTIWSLFERL